MRPLDWITSTDPAVRDIGLESWARSHTPAEWAREAAALEQFRRQTENLYERVRALVLLSELYRFYLAPVAPSTTLTPYRVIEHVRERRFEQALAEGAKVLEREPGSSLYAALAAAYRGLAFQTLAGQVRHSVRRFPGNQWMFRAGHALDYPLRLAPALLTGPPYGVLHEMTPVRMDLTHSAWSDIFFLAMDYPEGARVLNISVDLAIRGSGIPPRPPVEAFLRVIDEPVLRLVSVDLQAQADIRELDELFDFARDYLSLLKAAVIGSGLIPAALEASGQSLAAILKRLLGRPGLGLELVSQVNDIPKGSRLAVSTNLLACLISVCMRATGQIRSLQGPLSEEDRRQVAARAIFGEWLGGSGGGWQDSGGVWPGIKAIRAQSAPPGSPSRGELLPTHQVFGPHEIPLAAQQRLQDALVLVHGGMSQDVGPILEMCTERYLLRSENEWLARKQAIGLFEPMLASLQTGDIRELGRLTQANFDGPIQTIIPWACNAYTEALIQGCHREFGEDFWGFWMLGGMSGGGMGFLFDPDRRVGIPERLGDLLQRTKRQMEAHFPFAIEPVVYDFAINHVGTTAELRSGGGALLNPAYYAYRAPHELQREGRGSQEMARFTAAHPDQASVLWQSLLPLAEPPLAANSLEKLLTTHGFDRAAHEHLRHAYRSGLIGLAQNQLPPSTMVENVEVVARPNPAHIDSGMRALSAGQVAVVTLAGGIGSRWTKGAGVVKALFPFHRFTIGSQPPRYLNFVEVHAAKCERLSREYGSRIPHVVTASHLTEPALRRFAAGRSLVVSPGRSIGLRLVPTQADLRFLWEFLPQQQLDEQKQKVRDSLRASLLKWASQNEAQDYTDNVPEQCIHPVGHWYEIPNLLRNGVLRQLLVEQPTLQVLLVHNVDTLGVTPDPVLLGQHLASGATLTFEVIPRWFDDHGGGLALVDGRRRIVEGLALPGEETELGLSYYNTGTCWLSIDSLLRGFGLDRDSLADPAFVEEAVRRAAQRMPSYITIKEVKKRWGRGQEDVVPVAQFERLWGDMTAWKEIHSEFVEVSRFRGQQLKDVAQLDSWLRDGSAATLQALLAPPGEQL